MNKPWKYGGFLIALLTFPGAEDPPCLARVGGSCWRRLKLLATHGTARVGGLRGQLCGTGSAEEMPTYPTWVDGDGWDLVGWFTMVHHGSPISHLDPLGPFGKIAWWIAGYGRSSVWNCLGTVWSPLCSRGFDSKTTCPSSVSASFRLSAKTICFPTNDL